MSKNRYPEQFKIEIVKHLIDCGYKIDKKLNQRSRKILDFKIPADKLNQVLQ